MPEFHPRAPSQLEVGPVLTRSFRLYFTHLRVFLPIVFLFQALTFLGDWLLSGTVDSEDMARWFQSITPSFEEFVAVMAPIYIFLFGIVLLWLIMNGAIIHASLAILQGDPRPAIGKSLLAGLRYWPQNILWAFVIFCGFVCFVIPGIFLLCVYGTFLPALIAEKRGFDAASARASELSSGSRWSIFALFLILVVLFFAFCIGGGILQFFLHDIVWRQALNFVLVLFTPAFLIVWMPVLYHELVAFHEGGEEKTVEQIFA